eukprot:345535-Prymnesium_polylepis.1
MNATRVSRKKIVAATRVGSYILINQALGSPPSPLSPSWRSKRLQAFDSTPATRQHAGVAAVDGIHAAVQTTVHVAHWAGTWFRLEIRVAESR